MCFFWCIIFLLVNVNVLIVLGDLGAILLCVLYILRRSAYTHCGFIGDAPASMGFECQPQLLTKPIEEHGCFQVGVEMG